MHALRRGSRAQMSSGGTSMEEGISASAVWREALAIPYLFPDSESVLQNTLAFFTESFAFYLYVAYAEELTLEARRSTGLIPLPRVLRNLLLAAPVVPLVTVASFAAIMLPTAAAS